ncbi:sugar ABC transporter substrate-binding protein [Paenibacillus herberti]|uniref:ABC transporter substrate-binding protein n=1 Tax=Paenibacillus herberti TaxID=1619309 RepID=A0A229NSX8_9BACL|nr:sugar ABC transporter substrate-binding protein [Paenibacillus herberti]OXM12998.1 ABC transporter substrate-binding protein [Paenibacillus herberti]
MRIKSGSAILIGVLMAGSLLAGCSSGEGESGGKTTLNVWAMGDSSKPMEEMAIAFSKENPDIAVKVQAIPWGSAHDKLVTAVASKKGPDVLQMGSTWMAEFGNAGALADLTDELGKYPELAPENFFEGTVNSNRYEGRAIGVPWLAETRVLFYRTDLLKSVGYESAPKTWEELEDASRKLTERGPGMYGFNVDVKEPTFSFMFARQNGSGLIQDGQAQFEQAPFREAVDYLDGFIQKGYSPVDLGLDMTQTFGGKGIVPMFISGPWVIKQVRDQVPDVEGKWATAVLPAKENNISSLGGSNLSVFEFSKNKDEALKFIAFLSRTDNQLKWMDATGELPASKKAWEDPKLSDDPNMKVVGEQLQQAEPMPIVGPWDRISQNYLKTFEQIFRTDGDHEKLLQEFNSMAQRLLDR